MATTTVAGGKGTVEAESTTLIGLFFVAGKTEGPLGLGQEFGDLGLVGQVAGITALSRCRFVAAAVLTIALIIMATQAESFFIVLQLEFAGGTVAIMAGQTLTLDHRFMAADHLGLHWHGGAGEHRSNPGFDLVCDGLGAMAVETDLLGRLGQEESFVTGMDGVAGNTFLLLVGFVDTV